MLDLLSAFCKKYGNYLFILHIHSKNCTELPNVNNDECMYEYLRGGLAAIQAGIYYSPVNISF